MSTNKPKPEWFKSLHNKQNKFVSKEVLAYFEKHYLTSTNMEEKNEEL